MPSNSHATYMRIFKCLLYRLLLAVSNYPEATSALPGRSIVGLPDKTTDHPVAHS
jgi:hypothetical protein